MKIPALRPGLERARPIFGSTVVFLIALLMFLCSMAAVFYGFVGYYSRVSLSSGVKDIDYVFMRVAQIEQDDSALKDKRDSLSAFQKSTNATLINTRTAAYSSSEYKDYLQAISVIESILSNSRQLLDDKYWVDITQVSINDPDLKQSQLLSNPEFKQNASLEEQSKLRNALAPAISDLRLKIVMYNAKFGIQIQQINNLAKSEQEELRSGIREILARNLQWASPEEVNEYGLSNLHTDAEQQKEIASQRAIVMSYRKALGRAAGVLEWPTIVSTLGVTLAAGWLGGLVSFMGATVSLTRSQTPESRPGAQLVSLVRRAVLGITAALGIFLFAGSGLLVFTAQSTKSATSGSIELSPYFVAFLAFISGFLADDAFITLTRAGQSMLQTDTEKRNERRDNKQMDNNHRPLAGDEPTEKPGS